MNYVNFVAHRSFELLQLSTRLPLIYTQKWEKLRASIVWVSLPASECLFEMIFSFSCSLFLLDFDLFYFIGFCLLWSLQFYIPLAAIPLFFFGHLLDTCLLYQSSSSPYGIILILFFCLVLHRRIFAQDICVLLHLWHFYYYNQWENWNLISKNIEITYTGQRNKKWLQSYGEDLQVYVFVVMCVFNTHLLAKFVCLTSNW